jgi:hypothetical protein
MGWATGYIARLKTGQTVAFRPRGQSMTGKIESGQLCTVEPIADVSVLQVGDIVLCRSAATSISIWSRPSRVSGFG